MLENQSRLITKEIKFNSLLELKTRLRPALNSKCMELKNKKIYFINQEDIWEYLRINKWINTPNLNLAMMVDDILNTSNEEFCNYVLSKKNNSNNGSQDLPKKKEEYKDLL